MSAQNPTYQLGDAFVKSYYTVAATDPNSLPKFYEDGAAVVRGGRTLVKNASTTGKSLEMLKNPGAVLTVLSHMTSKIPGDQYMVTVKAVLEEGTQKSYIAQTFVLVEKEGRVFIRAASTTLLPTPILDLKPERSFQVGSAAPASEKPAAAPAKPATDQPAAPAKPATDQPAPPAKQGGRPKRAPGQGKGPAPKGKGNRFVWKASD